jgi:capsular exopolysaccharide synthesis family protein
VANVNDLAVVVEPRSPQAEAYRALLAGVKFASVDRSLRSLLVTSAGAEDDKAAVAANLAAIFAQSGSRVVLVDCDSRRPAQHALFGLSNERGLSTLALEGEDEPTLLPTGVDNLRLLPAGPLPTGAADVLGLPRVQAALQRLAESVDLLVYDAPPVLFVADTATLARRVDGVVVVFRAGRSSRGQASRAQALLTKAGANVLGAVLTNAKADRSLQQYYR